MRTANTLTYTTGALPAGATFVGGVFSWTPTFAQAGSYPGVTFTATDNGTPNLAASETITITVTNTNRAPVLAAIGNKTVAENATLTITPSASDADGDTLTYTTGALPAGATVRRRGLQLDAELRAGGRLPGRDLHGD